MPGAVPMRQGDEVAAMNTPGGRRSQKQPYSPKTPSRAAPSAGGRLGESPSGSTSTTTATTCAAPSSITWTLYDNPCFCSSHLYPDLQYSHPGSSIHRHRRRHHHHHHRKALLTPEKPFLSSSIPMQERLGTVLQRERAAVALERERVMREEVEALRVELARERQRREDAEQRAGKASEEVARWKAEAERMEGEVRAVRDAGVVQEQRARDKVAEVMLRFDEERRKLQMQMKLQPDPDVPTEACGGNVCDRSKEQQQQQKVASAEHGSGSGASSTTGANISPATTPSSQQQKHQRRDASLAPVENPHIRRGIIGFVEFPRVVSRVRGGLAVTRDGSKAGGAPKLECQKAQLRVLLKGGGGKVTPVVGFPSSAATHNLVM